MSCLGVGLLFFSLIIYLYKLANRLQKPLFPTQPAFSIETTDLSQATYDTINLVESIPNRPTSLGYAVIGGSGFLGTCIVQLLLLRGETDIRIVDLNPPAEKIASNPAVTFVETDITSLESVRRALGPFRRTGVPPKVIYHTAAIIRFWERFSYCWNASYKINVSGTANVIAAARELPSAILVYTSTADTAIPRPRFMKLGWDLDKNNSTVSDSDEPLSDARLSGSCYSRTKLLAEQLVTQADGVNNLRTGIIRPG
ncbi:hypothetical protein C0991_006382 [Blastosporella zonata]|nr:hypothetical protein C0991_006382 [Blastosporella zonata]